MFYSLTKKMFVTLVIVIVHYSNIVAHMTVLGQI